MKHWHCCLSAIAASGVSLILVAAAQAEPLRLRYSIWVGYGPLLVAVEKGFFAKEGVEVELIQIEDDTATLAALFAGQIDALATATQTAVSSNEPDEEALACVLMLDDSRGGDASWPPTTSRPSPTSRANRWHSAIAAPLSSTSTSCSRRLASARPISKPSIFAPMRRPKPS
jgi:hypothetical protein